MFKRIKSVTHNRLLQGCAIGTVVTSAVAYAIIYKRIMPTLQWPVTMGNVESMIAGNIMMYETDYGKFVLEKLNPYS